MRPHLAALVLLPFLAAGAPAADAPPFPAGMSSQTLEGLKVAISMPADFDVAK